MDSVSTSIPVSDKPKFFDHVFDFSEKSKGELINIVQYSLFMVIPLVILVRNMGYFFPKVDKTKGNLELVLEALGQMVLTIIILVFIHKIVTYFSTWSGLPWFDINYGTLVVVFVLFSLLGRGTGKVGKKLTLVWKNISAYPRDNFWDDDKTEEAVVIPSPPPVVKVSQPLSRLPPPIPTKRISAPTSQQTDMGNYIATQDAIAEQRWEESEGKNKQAGAIQQSVGEMGFFSEGAGAAPVQQQQEPMAANEAFGGFASF